MDTDEHFPNFEQNQIEQGLQEDLVDHLYKGAPIGSVTALVNSTAVAIFCYQHSNPLLVTSWLLAFYMILATITVLNNCYKKFKQKLSLKIWTFLLSVCISSCALLWGLLIFFNPSRQTDQMLLLAVIFMVASSFSLVNVGAFKLCIASLCFTLLPATMWLYLQPGEYYQYFAGFNILYLLFLLGMNYRSSKWLLNSLELSRIVASFTHQANHDFLTDLPNQRLLSQHIEKTIKHAKRTQQNFALMCFAVNRLEVFNNSLGYHAGDLIINSLSKRLKLELTRLAETRQVEYFLSRPRPDAFVILMSPVEEAHIEQDVKQLLNTLNEPFYFGNQESRLTASVGITLYPQDSLAPEKLLSNTYAAMFEAKSKGGNQITFYKAALTSNAPSQLALESELNHAIERKEFEAYYQPIIDLHTGRVSAVEALIRWNHPIKGLIPPLKFIPLAEATGLILPMGEWILEEAIKQTIIWHQQGLSDLKIAINLSAKQLRQGNLVEIIDKILAKTAIDPTYIELELTETAVLDESLAPTIQAISNKGIAFAIDDFGTGYSSFSYLKHFHIDKIKIDKTFIDDVTTNNDSATIVSAILAMAKELGIKALAEGVETKEQLQFLKERDCQYIQGYYFSKPLKVEELSAFMKIDLTQKI